MNFNLPSVFKDYDKFFVGFDEQYNRLHKLHDDLTKGIPNYPPYNIKKVSDDRYIIELAVAGFGKSEIDIELTDGKLVVKGISKEESELTNWIHRGIANRNFTRTFLLNDNLEVKDAEMFNGMLRIWLDMIIPEHKKPKKIAVKETGSASKEPPGPKQLLTE
jgi:molecular chaperone IbpA